MIFSLLISVAMAAGSTVSLTPVLTNTIKKDDVEYMFSPKLVGGFQGEKKPCVLALHLSARNLKKFDKTWSTPIQYAFSDGRDGLTDVPAVSEFSVLSGEVRLRDSKGENYVVDAKTGRLLSPTKPIVYGATSGFVIGDVVPGSIYEKLGFLKGDIIAAINGLVIKSSDSSKAVLSKFKKNQALNVIYVRDGQPIVRDVELK
jgi:C-terminal processing protease CtpA/Prc